MLVVQALWRTSNNGELVFWAEGSAASSPGPAASHVVFQHRPVMPCGVTRTWVVLGEDAREL